MRITRSRRLSAVLAAAGLALASFGASATAAAKSPVAPDGLTTKLATAFRSDVSDIKVTYDYWPSQERVDGHATLRLTMRPGQHRALFHFNPLRDVDPDAERKLLTHVTIDGEALDPLSDDDVRRIRPLPTAETAFEVERDLAPAVEHTLEVSWSTSYAPHPRYPGWFYATFDDTEGPHDEIEADFPTVSSPEELARHRIQVRVHTDQPYTVIGSGTVTPDAPDGQIDGAQSWLIDTGRAVSSSTVFFAAVPQAQVRTTRFATRGVDVTIVSDRSTKVTQRAERIATDTIGRLVDDLGPFPVADLDVLLTGWGSGMEYYGATRTGVGSLEHELGHMYFGTTTVNRTWRDTWFDEAAVVWWLRRDRLPPLPEGYTSNLARGRSPVAPGFDLRAYGAGARVLEEVARALGGNEEMVDFLADLHHRREFHPFTTDDLIDDIVRSQDTITRHQLEQWLYTPK